MKLTHPTLHFLLLLPLHLSTQKIKKHTVCHPVSTQPETYIHHYIFTPYVFCVLFSSLTFTHPTPHASLLPCDSVYTFQPLPRLMYQTAKTSTHFCLVSPRLVSRSPTCLPHLPVNFHHLIYLHLYFTVSLYTQANFSPPYLSPRLIYPAPHLLSTFIYSAISLYTLSLPYSLHTIFYPPNRQSPSTHFLSRLLFTQPLVPSTHIPSSLRARPITHPPPHLIPATAHVQPSPIARYRLCRYYICISSRHHRQPLVTSSSSSSSSLWTVSTQGQGG